MALEIFRLMGSVFVDTNKATKSLHGIDKTAEGFGKRLLSGIGTAAKWAAGVAVAAGTVGIALGKSAVDAYAEYEQLVGGVETLFGKSADQVVKYAQNAYKTAGMTANEYMATTTSFAAALLAGLGGDTAEAARIADMAITDMSDNANKMGTSIERIQDAYQGFAKQNYTMLDNLKLGYGGTKTEMQRLLKDADAINAKQGKITKYSLDNLNDVYEAIHVIQTEMGITGTTAKEATETISGQIGMIKARFENFKVTLGESLAPVVKSILGELIENLPTIEGMVGGLATAAVKVVDFAMPYITAALETLSEWFGKVPELLEQVRGKMSVVSGFLSETFSPALDGLRGLFDQLREAVQPYIDKLVEYVSSGEAAKTATDLLKGAIEAVATAAEWVVEKVTAFTDWCKEHPGTIQIIITIVGSFATAIGLVTAALSTWNKVTTLANTAATLLSSGIAAINWPVVLITAAIGALIAIGVLLYQNWDTIKAKCSELWSSVKEKFSQMKESVSTKVSEIKTAVTNKFNELKTAASNAITETKTAVANKFSEMYNSAKEKVTSIYTTVREKFNNVKTAVSEAIEGAKTIVSNGVEKLKGFFDFDWELPKIKLPHFSISGEFSLNPPSIPKLSVSWYKKAYEQAMILNDPTIFGYSAASGKALGAGDGNGNEVVVGEAHLLKMIDGVVAKNLNAAGSSELTVALLQDIRSILETIAGAGSDMNRDAMVRALVDTLAKPMDKRLGQLQAAKARG